MIDCVEQVDTFNGMSLCVIKVPGNQVVFLHVRFGLNSVVNDQHTVISFYLANQWLGLLPQVA